MDPRVFGQKKAQAAKERSKVDEKKGWLGTNFPTLPYHLRGQHQDPKEVMQLALSYTGLATSTR